MHSSVRAIALIARRPIENARRLSPSPGFIWSMTGAGLTVMLAFFVWIAADFRESTLAITEKQVANIAALVAQDIGRDVELYSLSLEAVLDGMQNPDVMNLPPQLRQLTLFDRSTTAPGLGALVVMDKAGNIILDSRSYPPRKGNFSDREYFQVQRESARDRGLYFSKPFHARLQSRTWSMSVSRRVSGKDGAFEGIVHLTVDLDYIRHRLEKILLGSHGSISLFRTDGILLTRTIGEENHVGKDWGALPLFGQLRETDQGVVRTKSPMDGVFRTYAFRRITGLPLVVSVGQSDAEALAPWQDKVQLLSLIYIVMALSILVLTALFVRELQRRATSERHEAARARHDMLTGLYNRLGFQEALTREWRRAARNNNLLSLLMIDVDHFKDFNDTYGHPEGDRILSAIAKAVALAVQRADDVAGRYGGEEIAVLLPETDLQGAAVVGEQIVSAVRALKIPHRQSSHGIVTVSVGIATMQPFHSQQPDSLIRLADAALYYAKNTGRNKASLSNVAPFETPGRVPNGTELRSSVTS